MKIVFMDWKHKDTFIKFLNKMRCSDFYHQSVAYLLSLDRVCRKHIEDIFDFKEDLIKLDCFDISWQTSTSVKTIRLAFNLWNSYYSESDVESCLVDEIFCCLYAPYYFEAIKLRFPYYFCNDSFCDDSDDDLPF